MTNNNKLPPSPSSSNSGSDNDDDGVAEQSPTTTINKSTTSSNNELSIGDIIWLKLESYPWWPAIIVNHATTSTTDKIPSLVLKGYQSHLLLVKFYSSPPEEQYYWMDPNKDSIKLFKNEPHLLDTNINVLKNHPNLKKAITQAKNGCGLLIEGDSKKRKNENESTINSKKSKQVNNEMNVDLVKLKDEELNSIKEELIKHSSNSSGSGDNSGDSSDSTEQLHRYLTFINDKCNEITVSQLKQSKIGQVVASLRKHSDLEISKMAKELVKTWTNLIGSASTSGSSTSGSTTTSNSTNATTTATTTSNASEKAAATTTTASSGSKKATSSVTTATTSTSEDSTKPKIKKVGSNTTTTTSTTTTTKQAPPLSIKPIKTSSSSSSLSSSTSKSPTTPSTPAFLFDATKLPTCSESNRNRWRQKFGEGLAKVPEADEQKVLDLCVQMEQAVYNHFKNTSDNSNNTSAASTTSGSGTNSGNYDDQCRTLSRNLNASNNVDFRFSVYHSTVSIEQLPSMKVQEMASREKQKENALLQKQKNYQSMVAKPAAVESSMFRCGKCKKTQCTFYEMQTRSADEPMTAFITCLSCGNRWKQ